MAYIIIGAVFLVMLGAIAYLAWKYIDYRAKKDAEYSVLESKKKASDIDVEKYAHEAKVHAGPDVHGPDLADRFRKLRDGQ